MKIFCFGLTGGEELAGNIYGVTVELTGFEEGRFSCRIHHGTYAVPFTFDVDDISVWPDMLHAYITWFGGASLLSDAVLYTDPLARFKEIGRQRVAAGSSAVLVIGILPDKTPVLYVPGFVDPKGFDVDLEIIEPAYDVFEAHVPELAGFVAQKAAARSRWRAQPDEQRLKDVGAATVAVAGGLAEFVRSGHFPPGFLATLENQSAILEQNISDPG